MKNNNDFVSENFDNKNQVKKGNKVRVKMTFYQELPVYEVEAQSDSWFNQESKQLMFAILEKLFH